MTTVLPNTPEIEPSPGMSRRALIGTAAWSVPAIVAVTAVPAFAASAAGALSLTTPGMQVAAAGSTAVTAQLEDTSGQPLAGKAVALTGPSGSSFSPATPTTNGSGVATTTLTTADAWATPGTTITLTATSEGVTATAPLTVLGANVYAVGGNASRQLGTGATAASVATPAQLSLVFTSPIRAAVSGQAFSLVLLDDGTVWGIGDNSSGQLGDGTTTNRSTWTKNPSLTGVTKIAAGPDHAHALLSDGTVRSWGSNGTGQLGNGTTSNSNTPVTVTGITGATQIAAGSGFALALRSNGEVYGWGASDYWQIGAGSYDDAVTTPLRVLNVSNATQVAAFNSGGYALVGNQVYSWGVGDSGELGHGEDAPGDDTGENTASNAGRPIPGLSGVTQIAAGGGNGYALLSNGTVKAWGAGDNGQLGNGTTTNQYTPVDVTSLNGATRITAVGASAYALVAFGLSGPGDNTQRLRAWGRNAEGQLGDGTTTNQTTPVSVQDATNVTTLAVNSTSASHTFFLR